MTRTSRRPLIAWLVALHAAIAIVAPSLHALPGLGHSTPRASAEEHRDAAPPITAAAEHCSVCEYLAQGQLPIGAPVLVVELTNSRADSPEAPPEAPRVPITNGRPRSPPLA